MKEYCFQITIKKTIPLNSRSLKTDLEYFRYCLDLDSLIVLSHNFYHIFKFTVLIVVIPLILTSNFN